MQKLRIPPDQIGFDFDGVIADIGEAFLRMACDEHKFTLTLNDLTSFQVETCTDIPEKVVHQIFADILHDSLATRLLPIPGALEVISELAGHSRVKIITARSHDQPVIDWLENYLPPAVCKHIDLIAMSDHDRKVRYIKDHRLKYFVDDRAETCAQVAEANLHPLLYRQPWNNNWNGFTTVDNWDEIDGMIARTT